MHAILAVDWKEMLVPTISLLELVLRGSLMYLGILAAMRIFRREAGALNTADLLVVVLVADAAQNGMSSKYNSVTEAIVLVSTIFVLNYLLDWLAFHYPMAHRILHPEPMPLVLNGRVQRKAMRAELLTLEDLKEQLREHGVEHMRDVKRCCLEADGHMSVIRRTVGEDWDEPRQSSAH